MPPSKSRPDFRAFRTAIPRTGAPVELRKTGVFGPMPAFAAVTRRTGEHPPARLLLPGALPITSRLRKNVEFLKIRNRQNVGWKTGGSKSVF